MAHGKIRVNTLTYDTGSGDVDVDISTIPSSNTLNDKADLNNPQFTGTPTAPTASSGTNTTQLATTAFVQAANAALVDSAPGTLNTLNELAAALGDDANFSTTVTNSIASKIGSTGGTITGNLALQGTTSIAEIIEKAQFRTSAVSGTIPFDLLDGSVIYCNVQASGDFTINLRGNATTTLDSLLTVGDVVTIAFIYETPSNLGYYNQGKIQIDGATNNHEQFWINEPTASVATGAFVVMTYTVVKTASNTFRVLGQTSVYE